MRVVREQDRGAGPTKATTTGFDGVLTWRFRARNVRDFDLGRVGEVSVGRDGRRRRRSRPRRTA